MISNRYRYFLDLCKFLRCYNRLLQQSVQRLPTPAPDCQMTSCARFATAVQKSIKVEKKKTDKKPEGELQEGEVSNPEQKDSKVSSKNTTHPKVLTSSKNDVNVVRAEKNQPQKGIDDFTIRNIMSYPLHVSVEETESEEFQQQYKATTSFTPSVSVILQETMSADSRRKLETWKQNMMKELGEEQFYKQQKDPAKKLSKNNKKSNKILVATLNRGSKFHSSLKQYLLSEVPRDISIDKEVEGCWNSVMNVLPEISDVKAVEHNIIHPHLRYKGILDCVASYRNVPHLIEWKQSEKPKKDLSSTFDAPLQLSAYMGALSWSKNVNLATPVTNGLVVVAYIDGSPAEVFQMNLEFCQSYWQQWLRRVQQYWMIRSHSLRPATG